MSDCLFCKIVSGAIPANKVAESDKCLAFRDIGPKAPTHILVIPKEHVASINDLADTSVMADMTAMAKEIAAKEGIAESGFRLVVNTGAGGGQTVFHLHMHVLGGRQMKWPPG
jgi:histidine triad (HIT) family protein